MLSLSYRIVQDFWQVILCKIWGRLWISGYSYSETRLIFWTWEASTILRDLHGRYWVGPSHWSKSKIWLQLSMPWKVCFYFEVFILFRNKGDQSVNSQTENQLTFTFTTWCRIDTLSCYCSRSSTENRDGQTRLNASSHKSVFVNLQNQCSRLL